jgi:hypothetical protein
MSLPYRFFSGLLALSLVTGTVSLVAQSAPPQPVMPPDIHQALAGLADQPPTHMGFVLDRSMLSGAQQILESQGMTPERASAALTSIAYDNYRYAQPATYAPSSMNQIMDAYHAAGWRHMVDSHEKAYASGQVGPDGSPARRHQVTDLWLHFSGDDIDGITVMTRGAKNVNLVQVACDLRPIELLHLAGHFGIPKVDPGSFDHGAVMVPDPKDR